MKRLIIMIAAVVVGTCFAVDGDCIGIGPIGGTNPIIGPITGGLSGADFTVLADPCARVRNHLDDFGTCPAGESCVNMSVRLERISGNNISCRLFAETVSWQRSRLRERFIGVDGEGRETILMNVNTSYDNLDFEYLINDAPGFTTYDQYKIRWDLRFGPSSSRRIAFTSIEYTPASTPSADADGDSDTDSDGGAGGGSGDGEAGGGPAGGGDGGGSGGGEGEVTDLCASVTCLEGQTCDPATGACAAAVAALPTDLCAGVICPEGQVCQTSTGACVAVPPAPNLCASMTCPSGQVCSGGVCTISLGREGGGDFDRTRPEFDTSEGGCQLSPHAASGASGAPYLWLTVTGIALTIARRRLLRR